MLLHILARILAWCPDRGLDLLGNAVSVAYAYREQAKRHQRISDLRKMQAWLN
jgi:hypothetical protein